MICSSKLTVVFSHSPFVLTTVALFDALGGGGAGGGRDRPAPSYEDGRYVSAYSSEQSQFLTSEESAKIAAKGDAALDEYAKVLLQTYSSLFTLIFTY